MDQLEPKDGKTSQNQDGMMILHKTPQEKSKTSPEPKEAESAGIQTAILLGEITLILMKGSSVKPAYHFTFLQSRHLLFLGRSKEKCGEHSVILDAESISACHATIRWKDNSFFLQDEGSANGTYLEDRKLSPHSPALLGSRGTIRLGDVAMHYRLETTATVLAKGTPENKKEAAESKKEAAESKKEAAKDQLQSKGAEGFVMAEFTLLSLDAPCALPHHCEIMSNRTNIVIGKGSRCDYQVEFKERYVANEQAIIMYSAAEQLFAIKGLVKENPIFINSQRVQEVQRLKSGDIIRLGIAVNAPKVRFTIEGDEKSIKETVNLSEIFEKMERGKTYRIGTGAECQIHLSDPAVAGCIAELKVPPKGDHLLVTLAEGNKVKVTINSVELVEKESRALLMHQTLDIGNFYSLIHDHQNFVSPRVPEECLFSYKVPSPKRGEVYGIGSAPTCAFRIEDPNLPALVAEIAVPSEGDYFLIRRLCGDIPIAVGDQDIGMNPRSETRWGVNQILYIGDYIQIRNNRRTLPPAPTAFPWRKLVTSTLICVFISALLLSAGYLIQNYWHRFNFFLSTQEVMQKYQKNTVYIAALPKEGEESSSGTGFLLTQKSAEEKDIFYIVTCKHVIEPWKFKKHQVKENKILDEQGKEIQTSYYIAVWPYNSQTIEPQKKQYLIHNSFTNYPIKEKLGNLIIHKLGQDVYQDMGQGFQQHSIRTNEDIAILRVASGDESTTPAIDKPVDNKEGKPDSKAGNTTAPANTENQKTDKPDEKKEPNKPDEKKEPNARKAKPKQEWAFPYEKWHITEKKKIEVGEGVIVIGYSSGGGRLINKSGTAVPVVCEGKLVSSCEVPDFLEINANQTQGASGGPIINYKGEIVGIVAFTDMEKKLIYGIHAICLHEIANRP